MPINCPRLARRDPRLFDGRRTLFSLRDMPLRDLVSISLLLLMYCQKKAPKRFAPFDFSNFLRSARIRCGGSRFVPAVEAREQVETKSPISYPDCYRAPRLMGIMTA
jgi:hypothetical protein